MNRSANSALLALRESRKQANEALNNAAHRASLFLNLLVILSVKSRDKVKAME